MAYKEITKRNMTVADVTYRNLNSWFINGNDDLILRAISGFGERVNEVISTNLRRNLFNRNLSEEVAEELITLACAAEALSTQDTGDSTPIHNLCNKGLFKALRTANQASLNLAVDRALSMQNKQGNNPLHNLALATVKNATWLLERDGTNAETLAAENKASRTPLQELDRVIKLEIAKIIGHDQDKIDKLKKIRKAMVARMEELGMDVGEEVTAESSADPVAATARAKAKKQQLHVS